MSNALPVAGAGKITPTHRERQAIVYVRQSSPKQVREHPESQLNQRALVHRAHALGWHAERVVVLDADLGLSATQAAGREAFTALAAEVALGHVGMILGWEASRLARNNADWYHLLDVAALFGTLIADIEGVYDPRLYNDRLLLGLKGTMSEAELHLMRQRLTAGRLSKVARGEYVQHLPTGLVRLPDQRVVLDPDDQVRQILALVFAQFARLGRCPKVLRFFREHDLLLPRRQTSGPQKGELLWKKPSVSALYEVLGNPAYAGAFVYGRRPKDPTRAVPGRPARGFVRQPREAWHCVQQHVYPAYLTWEQYLANQATMRANAQRYRDHAQPGPGALREGAALLQGLATCGECGYRMKVAYKPAVRYLCDGLAQEYGERQCASLDGASIEAAVVAAFLEAIQPAQLDALEALLGERQQERAQVARCEAQQIERARYEAELARRRYESVDPANRLVAAELERRWEAALIALRQAEEAAARRRQAPEELSLDPKLRHQLEHIAQALPELWANGALTNEGKKQLLRSLIARVILQRTAPDQVAVRIVWVSGHCSVVAVQPRIERQCDVSGYDRLVARVQALWAAGASDAAVAAQLTAEGFHSARSATVIAGSVQKIRLAHGWHQRLHRSRGATAVDGELTAAGLAQAVGVGRGWVYRRLARGEIEPGDYTRDPQSGTYRIANDAALVERLKAAAGRVPASGGDAGGDGGRGSGGPSDNVT